MELALGIVGGAVGSVFGATMLGWAVGTTLGGAITALTTTAPEQNVGRLDDLKLSTSSNAQPIPRVFGKMRVAGNVIWQTNLTERRTSVGGGKKKPRISRYEYTLSCAVLVCRGSITRIRTIWADDQIIYTNDGTTVATKETLRVYTGTEVQTADSAIVADKGSSNTPAYRGRAYVVFENLNVTPYGNRLPNFSFEVEQASTTTLDSITNGVCQDAGLTAGELNTSAGTDSLTGYLVSGRQPARSTLEPLLRAFAADLVEVDGTLKLVKRGGAAVATVDVTELGASASAEPGGRWEVRRTPEIELPARYDVAYLVAGKQYQQGNQSAVRSTKTGLQGAGTLNLAAAVTDDVARRIAELLLYTAWRERESFRVLLPIKYLFCAPGDVLNIPIDGNTRRLRIEEMDAAPIGAIACICVLDGTDVLTQTATGAVQTASSPAVTSPVATTFKAFSAGASGVAIELTDDAATTNGFYVVANGGAGWQGGRIYWSPDSGTTWIEDAYISLPSAIGTTVSGAAGDLEDYGGSLSSFDTVSDVDLTLTIGSIAPASQTEVTYGANRALIGNEVVGFAGATLGGSTWTLATFLRGQRGTAPNTHGSSERFYTLENAVRVIVLDSLEGASVRVKVVSPGQSLGDVTHETVTIGTNSGKPWATPSEVTAAVKTVGGIWSSGGTYTLATNETFLPLAWGGNPTSPGEVYLPLRSEAQGPITIISGDDTYWTLKVASGSSDDMEFPDVGGGGTTTGTSSSRGVADGIEVTIAAPKKGSANRWVVYAYPA